jgi:hypothetical protein
LSIWWKYYVLIYENGEMRLETILRMGEGDKGKRWRE